MTYSLCNNARDLKLQSIQGNAEVNRHNVLMLKDRKLHNQFQQFVVELLKMLKVHNTKNTKADLRT